MSLLLTSISSFGQENIKEMLSQGNPGGEYYKNTGHEQIEVSDVGRVLKSSFYIHYCHSRGSLISRRIMSSNGSKLRACAERGMEAGQAWAYKYTCQDGRKVYSTLSQEEACGQENEIMNNLEFIIKNDHNF